MALRLIFLCGLLVTSAPLYAEVLPDPTRPPASMENPTAPSAVPTGPVVQVIRTVRGQRSALISGQQVVPGSKLGETVVTRIEEDRVELRGPEGTQILRLFPDVEKRPIVAVLPTAQAKKHKVKTKQRAYAPSEKAKRKEGE